MSRKNILIVFILGFITFMSGYLYIKTPFITETLISPFGNAKIEKIQTERRVFAMPGDGYNNNYYSLKYSEKEIKKFESSWDGYRYDLLKIKWYRDSVSLTFNKWYEKDNIKNYVIKY